MRTTLQLSVSTVAILAMALLPTSTAHTIGASVADTVYVLDLHQSVLVVAETNGVTTNGVILYSPPQTAGTTGAQIHDACIFDGWTSADYAALYPSQVAAMGLHFYDYVIAQTTAVGFMDEPDVADAMAFWASNGVDMSANDPDFHGACMMLGGMFAHADAVAGGMPGHHH